MRKPALFTAVLLLAQPAWVLAATPLAKRVELALRCKADPLDTHDPVTRKWLQQQGVRITDHDPEGPPDQVFHFTPPIKVAGIRIKRLYYQADSGGIFMAEFDGDMTRLAQTWQLKPHAGDEQQRHDDGGGMLDVHFIDKAAGPDVMQQVIGPFIANPKRLGWGCHFYDG